jgi:hypothetical protein
VDTGRSRDEAVGSGSFSPVRLHSENGFGKRQRGCVHRTHTPYYDFKR